MSRCSASMSDRHLSKNKALLLYLIAAAGLLITPFIDRLLAEPLGGANAHVFALIINLIYYVPFIAVPCVLLLRRSRGGLRMGRLTVAQVFFLCTLAPLCVYLVNDVTILWALGLEKLGLNASSAAIAMPQTKPELLLEIFAYGVIPAACEEVLMRGAVLSAFETRGTKRAILITTVGFAALHASVTGLPGELLMGFVLGSVAVTFDSVFAAMIVHTGYNAALLIIEFMQRSIPVPEGDLLTRIGGVSALSGIFFDLLLMIPFAFLMRAYYRGCIRRKETNIVRPRDPMFTRRELPLLFGCGVIIIVMYAVNILSMTVL